MAWVAFGIVLVILSFVLRYLGVQTTISLCREHWDTLFGPKPGNLQPSHVAAPLFPSLSPADFDDLIIRDSTVLRQMPPEIMKAGMTRIGLRNWGKAFFWIGVALIVVGFVQ